MSEARFELPWVTLRKLGIMGLNERNADFILRYNERKNYPLVDNKRLTKLLAIEAGIQVPALYGMVEIIHEIEALNELLQLYEDFVVKPAHGTGGEGILIVTGRHNGKYRLVDGTVIDDAELGHHVANILGGMYSLGGLPDSALIEYRVKFNPIFEHISYQGIPDIRTLVFRGVPCMAMIRLPTRLSGGRANLHQGAIGVGIDMLTGLTCTGVWHESLVEHHPDTGSGLSGLAIPHWPEILDLTAECHDLVKLGFIGVDIVLDEDNGPMMLEINARPGLSIQLANRHGLLSRLRWIENLKEIPQSVEARVSLAMEMCRAERQE